MCLCIILSHIAVKIVICQKQTLPPSGLTIDQEKAFKKQVSRTTDYIHEDGAWRYDTEYDGGKTFDRFLGTSTGKRIPVSRSLVELRHTTPKALWGSVPVRLILSFNSLEEMSLASISSFKPEKMQVLPITIIDTTLQRINDIESIPGLTGVYLDENIPFIEEDWISSTTQEEGIFTYPVEEIVGARHLQNLGVNGTGVTIAILDTGIDKNHPDLDDIDNDDSTNDPKVILEASFIDFNEDGLNDTSPMDDYFHGTHVAGIAAGNGFLKGVAPGAFLMNGKVLDKTVGGYTSWIVKGIDWAVLNGADIISMSLGGLPGSISPLFEEAINAAWENGTLIITSAGNSGPRPSSISSPGSESRAITVGASNVYNDVAFFSSRGPSPNGVVDPDIVAPGRGILSLDLGDQYAIASGTSMSAPVVAGVAALLLSGKPGANPDEIRSAILSTASDMGRHVFSQGAGLVNATAALAYLQSPSVFAYPSFSDSSPLVLSPGEIFEYQFDVFLNQSLSSLSISLSPQLEPHVNVSILDPNHQGWVRARIQVGMPENTSSGIITVKNGSTTYYEVELFLQPDKIANDAESGTDAGDTFAGAIPITIGIPITGEVLDWDRDIYSFPVIKDQAYSIELTNLTGTSDIFITDENGTIFNVSFNVGPPPEKIMFVATSTGDYFVRIEDQTPGKYTLLVGETDEEEYLLTQPAYLTGKMGSSTNDIDSDGLFDELKFSIEANVSIAGKYDFWYSIAQARSTFRLGLYVFMWDWLNLTLTEGVQNLTIAIPGDILESTGYNGSYIINELAFGKNDFSLLLYYDSEIFQSPSYNHTSFDPLDNRLTSYNIGEGDIDGDGVPENIKIELKFEFSTTGVYEVGIPIFNENQNEILAFNTSTFVVSQPGSTSVSIEFMAQKFEKKFDLILFGIVGSWFRYSIPVFSRITKETLTNFEPIIDYTIIDQPVDSDSNRKYDTIRFTYSIKSKIKTDAVLFTGHPFSYPNETMIIVSSTEKNVTINQGISNLRIDFDARILESKNLIGPYFFPNLGLTIEFEDYDLTKYLPYVTQSYLSSTFEPPVAWFSTFFGGNKYETSDNAGIEVIWEVTATQQAEVLFEADFRDYVSFQGTFSKVINYSKQISAGEFNVSFKIEAEDLYHSRYIGSLEVYSVSIYSPESQDGLKHRYQETNLSLVDFKHHAGILPSIHYEDYAVYVDALFVSSPEIKMNYNSSNSLLEGFLVNTTIRINKLGTYKLEIDLFSENDYSHQNIGNTTMYSATEIGNHSISFFFSAKTIVRNGFDKIVYGNISIVNVNTLSKSELTIPRFLLDINEFNYELPVQSVEIISESALDKDLDGNFDVVTAQISIKVVKESDFTFSAGIYGQLNDHYEAFLGNVSISQEHLTVGSHNISLDIPYYYFLAVFQKAEELDIVPKIEIFIVPFYSTDEEGMFVVSSQPTVLKQIYDLREFYLTQPLSIGYFKINQGYSDITGMVDKLEVNIAINVKNILVYTLEVSLEVEWDGSFNSLEKKRFLVPRSTGIIYSNISFLFSEIFSSSIFPSQFRVKASITVTSFDGVRIDQYITPTNILFHIEPYCSTTSAIITTSTTSTTTSADVPVIEFLDIISFLLVIGLITKKKKKRDVK